MSHLAPNHGSVEGNPMTASFEGEATGDHWMGDAAKWTVWRQDVNGNRIVVQCNPSRVDSDSVIRQLDARG